MKVAKRAASKAIRKIGKILLPSNAQTQAQLDEVGKLSIAQCKAILCKEGATYSDEQISLIRQALYTLAGIDYKYHYNLKQKRRQPEQHHQEASGLSFLPVYFPSNITTDNEQQNSYSLHPRIYRRAS